MADYISRIRSFILENFLFDAEDSELPNEASFLELGLIDSTGVLELVDWLEEEFNMTVDDDELIPENLDSVELLARFIERKIAI